MITIIFFSLFFFPINYLYGIGAIWLIQRIFGLPREETPNIALVCVTGIMTLGTLGNTLSLFLPLAGLSLGIVGLGAGLIFIWGKTKKMEVFPCSFRRQRFNLLIGILGVLIVATVLISATRVPSNPDTGIYHAQAIRWIETYPVVPGLGNLHHRFAYNSSWLVLNALFSLAFLGGQSFHLLPAMLTAIVLFDFLRGLAAWQRGEVNLSNILRTLLIPVFFYTQVTEISSPGTDLPGSLFLWIIILSSLDIFEHKPQNITISQVVLFVLSIFTLTIKLSTIPVLLVAGIIAWFWRRDAQTLIKLAGVALVITIPWIARNIMLSGYLLYPFAGINIFNPDWKIPVELVKNDQRAIMAWARIPREDTSIVLSYPLKIWFQIWFNNLTANRKIIILFGGISPFLMLAEYFWAKNQEKRTRKFPLALFISYTIVLFGGSYWLFTAPDFRFGYGFLMLLLLFPFLPPIQIASIKTPSKLQFFQVGLTIFLILFQTVFLIQISKNFTGQQLIAPQPYLSLPTEPCVLQNRTIFCPAPISYQACWYQPFPCALADRPQVALRGPDFQNGFQYIP